MTYLFHTGQFMAQSSQRPSYSQLFAIVYCGGFYPVHVYFICLIIGLQLWGCLNRSTPSYCLVFFCQGSLYARRNFVLGRVNHYCTNFVYSGGGDPDCRGPRVSKQLHRPIRIQPVYKRPKSQ